MAKKKKTKKAKTPTTKKKKKAPKKRRDSHIKFRCILSRCTPLPRRAHIGEVGDLVKLEAMKTNAVIVFRRGRSPFRAVTIRLRSGVPVTKTIVRSGTFEYDVSCSACSRGPAGPPAMIVD